ncbi:MAG: IclR family transcriptional regulator [Pseudoruegeria sp.]
MSASGGGDGTVGKALEVLDIVSSFERPVRFSEIEERSAYPKATTYRLIQTLTNQRMLSFDPDMHTYAPGLRLVRMAHAAWTQSSLAPIARPLLDELSLSVGETVHLAQLDHAQVLYVDKRNAKVPVEMYSQAGKVGPAYCTGVGKAMMAFLDEQALTNVIAQQSFHRFTEQTLCNDADIRAEIADIRVRGFAFDREEHEPGIICVALPILTRKHRVLGALSITSTTNRNTLDDMAELAPIIRDTARRIAEVAEDWRFPDAGSQNQRTEI